MRYLVLVLVFVGCGSDPQVKRGDPAERKAATVKYQTERCDDGDMKACAELGLRYARADGVPQDFDKATELTRKACDAKVARGCGYLAGRLIAEANGTAETARASIYERAYTLAERACSGGDGVGCHHLASLYESGLGTNRAPARALSLYVQACEGKVAPSCASAGSLLERGTAGTIEETRAADFYKEACVADFPGACAAEARIRVATSYDAARGRALATAGCTKGDALACGVLGLASTPIDISRVETACNQGQRSMCLSLVDLIRAGQATGDELRQRTLLRSACDAGWKRGCDELAKLATAPIP